MNPKGGHLDILRANQWKPGQSGNPAGRPKGLEQMAREHTPAAIKRLVEALKDADSRVAVRAAEILLERGWGKPKQVIENDPDNPVSLGYVVQVPMPSKSPEAWLDAYAPPVIDGRETVIVGTDPEP